MFFGSRVNTGIFSLSNAATIVLLAVTFIGRPAPVEANGIDSAQGVDLPISAGNTGNPVVVVGAGQNVPVGDVEFTGGVGIGTTIPRATLDVNGTIKTGNGKTGSACAQEGAFAYDLTAHAPVYCNQSGVWAAYATKPQLQLTEQWMQGDDNLENGAEHGPHDFCAITDVYQNGSNGWAGLVAGPTDANGKRMYTVQSTCADQGCTAGTLTVDVNCFDFQ